jgi:hypothetical protein
MMVGRARTCWRWRRKSAPQLPVPPPIGSAGSLARLVAARTHSPRPQSGSTCQRSVAAAGELGWQRAARCRRPQAPPRSRRPRPADSPRAVSAVISCRLLQLLLHLPSAVPWPSARQRSGRRSLHPAQRNRRAGTARGPACRQCAARVWPSPLAHRPKHPLPPPPQPSCSHYRQSLQLLRSLHRHGGAAAPAATHCSTAAACPRQPHPHSHPHHRPQPRQRQRPRRTGSGQRCVLRGRSRWPAKQPSAAPSTRRVGARAPVLAPPTAHRPDPTHPNIQCVNPPRMCVRMLHW